MTCDYLTRDSQMPPYLIFPRLLFDTDLLPVSIFVYVLLLDRARLSLNRDGWTDKDGRAVIVYTVDDLAAALHRSEKTIRLSLNALAEKGLIEKVHQGIGKADFIYVKVPRDGGEPSQSVGGNVLPPTPVTDDRRQRYSITADDGNALPLAAVADYRPKGNFARWQSCPRPKARMAQAESKIRTSPPRKQITGDGGNPLPGSKNEGVKTTEQKPGSKNIRGYGEYENVFLSDEEYARLHRDYPHIQPLLDDMSCYLASTGKTYQNYEAALRSWARRSKDSCAAVSYEYKEGESL
ncbi:MAG: replication initiator protein A [Clostridia bacterium]|nr:replication initiator protein A [Clostridia bacterium]